jgi:hypothetical protein
MPFIPIHTKRRSDSRTAHCAERDYAMCWKFRDSSPRQARRFSLPESPDGLWGKRSLPFNVYRSSSLRQRGRGVMLTNHIPLALRLWMNGAIPLLPLMFLWGGQGQLYCTSDCKHVENDTWIMNKRLVHTFRETRYSGSSRGTRTYSGARDVTRQYHATLRSTYSNVL